MADGCTLQEGFPAMGAIQLDVVSTGAAGSSGGMGAVGGPASQNNAVSLETGQGLSTSPTPSTAVMVQTKVDALLSSIDSELAGDRQLRMIIALLILNALLGSDDDERTSRIGELIGLASLVEPFARRADYALFSATNIIQIQHQSTLVYTDQAVQTISEAGTGGEGSPGSRLDVTG